LLRVFFLWLTLGGTLPAASAQDTLAPVPPKRAGFRPYVAPTVLLAGSLVTLRETGFLNKIDLQADVRRLDPNFRSAVDDYLPYVPLVLVYGLDAVGVKTRNDFLNRSLILVKAEVLSQLVTQSVKRITRFERPDGSDQKSWPSGHTTQAFVAATFLRHELGERSVWFSIGGYTLASGVGLIRILNNEHWVPDVLAGAAVGIASTEFIYQTHRYRWGKRRTTALTWVPFRAAGATGVLVRVVL
jgi:membrane-associated phospholipid phosphatase